MTNLKLIGSILNDMRKKYPISKKRDMQIILRILQDHERRLIRLEKWIKKSKNK